MSSIQQELDNLGTSPTLEDLDAAIRRIWEDINGGRFLQSEANRRQRAAYEFLGRAARELDLPGLYTLPNGRYFIVAGDTGRAVAGAEPRVTQQLARVGLVPQAARERYDRIFGNREGYGPLPDADTTVDRLPPFVRAILVGNQVQTWNVERWLGQNSNHFYIIVKDILQTETPQNGRVEPRTYRARGRLFNASVDELRSWAEANPRRIEDNKVYNQDEEQVYPEPEEAPVQSAAPAVSTSPERRNDTQPAATSPNLAAFATSGKGGLRNDPDERAAIRELQEFLQRLGLDIGAAEPDERYGRRTRTSVETFQRLVGFTGDDLDGDAGPDTIAKIQEVIADVAEIERLTAEAARVTTNNSYDPVMKSFLGKLLYEELSNEEQEQLRALLDKWQTLLDGLPENAPIRQSFTNARSALEGGNVAASNFTIDPNAQGAGAERNDRYRWILNAQERTLALEYFETDAEGTRTFVRKDYTELTYPDPAPNQPNNNLSGKLDGETVYLQRRTMPNLYAALPERIPVEAADTDTEQTAWVEIINNDLPDGWPDGYELWKKRDENEWYVQPPGDNEAASETFDNVNAALEWANNHRNGSETATQTATQTATALSTADRTRLASPDTVLTAEDLANVNAEDLTAILTGHMDAALTLHSQLVTDSRVHNVTLDTLYESLLLFEQTLTGEEAVRLQRHIRNLMIIRNSPAYSQIEANIRRDMESLIDRVPEEFRSETPINAQEYDSRAANADARVGGTNPLNADGLPVYQRNFAIDIRRLENFLLTQNPTRERAFDATDSFMEIHEKDPEEYAQMSDEEINGRLQEVQSVVTTLSQGANIDLESRQALGVMLEELQQEVRRRENARSSTTSVSDNPQDIQAFIPNANDVFYQDSRRNENILRVINDNNDDEFFVRQTRDGKYMLTDVESDGRIPVRMTNEELQRLNSSLHYQATAFFGDYQFGNDFQENMKLLLLTSRGRSPGLVDQFLQSINLQSMAVAERRRTLESLRNLQAIMLGNVRPPIDVHPRALITHSEPTIRVISTFINDNSDVFVQPTNLPTDVPEAQAEKARTLYQAMSGGGVDREQVTNTVLSIATREEYEQVDRAFQAYSDGEALWDFIDSQWFFSTVRLERHLQSIGIQIMNDSIRILDLTNKLLEKR